MTRLAAGGRAPQPGLLCRAWFRYTARRNRKARKAAVGCLYRCQCHYWSSLSVAACPNCGDGSCGTP